MSVTGIVCLSYHCVLGTVNWVSSFYRWEGILFLDGLCQPFVTPWTIALQVSLSVGFSRQKYWNGLPSPTPENLPDTGIKPVSLKSSALAGGFFTTIATWETMPKPQFSSVQLLSRVRLSACP